MNGSCTTCAADLYVGHCETVKWRNAEAAKLRAENERLRSALKDAAEALADIHTHEESCFRGTAYSGDRADTAEDAAREALAGQSEGDPHG